MIVPPEESPLQISVSYNSFNFVMFCSTFVIFVSAQADHARAEHVKTIRKVSNLLIEKHKLVW